MVARVVLFILFKIVDTIKIVASRLSHRIELIRASLSVAVPTFCGKPEGDALPPLTPGRGVDTATCRLTSPSVSVC